MEAQIKEEVKEASICCDVPADDLGSLSFVEKYSRYIQNENLSDIDSDCDFFPDDAVLREEYAQLTRETATYQRAKHNRLSAGFPIKFRSISSANRTMPEESNDVGKNGATTNTTHGDDTITGGDSKMSARQKDVAYLNELIENLAEVRKTGPEGNSIFCTQEELEAIQERYGAILDFLQEKSTTFELRDSSKDSENEEQVDVGHVTPEEQRESMRLLQEKIMSVQQARDRLNEIRNQVTEQIEQLEIFERTKMETVG